MSLDLKVGFPSLPYVFKNNETTTLDLIKAAITDHTYRAKKLIHTIALGILGMVPLTLYSILNRKTPYAILNRSMPSLFNSALIISGIALSIRSIFRGVKYFNKQKTSIREINLKIEVSKQVITQKLGADFQSEFYEQRYRTFIVNDDLTNNEQIIRVLSSVLKTPDKFLNAYPTQVVYKSTLFAPSLSIFTTATSPLVTYKQYGDDLIDRNQSFLDWRKLLNKLVESNEQFPKGTLECVAALSIPFFDALNTKVFGIDPSTYSETQHLPYVLYHIAQNDRDALIYSISYIKEGVKYIISPKTPDDFISFLNNDLGYRLS